MDNLKSGLTNVVLKLSTAKDDIEKVPTNNATPGNATIIYKGKISDP